MSAPTVLHFIETAIPGGAESMLLDLCRHQLAAGLRPAVAHFEHPWFTEHCRAIGVDSFTLPERARFKKSATLPLFALAFARRMRRGGIGLLHSHLFGPIVGGSLAARAAGIPHIGTLHDIHMIEDAPARIWQLRVALGLGTHLVTVSNQMRDFYRQHLRWAPQRTSCIHNGVDPTDGVVPVSRAELGVAAGAILAIMVGRVVPLKRMGDALRALRLLDTDRPLTLVVVGDGPELEPLKALATELGVSARVRFLGARRDVPALLRAADLFIQCSETEGLSMSIIEALHAGLPCLVTRVGGNPELVRHEYNGALFEVGDYTALSQWLGTLAADPRQRQIMGERARELALAQYTSRACAAAYLSLYKNSGLKLT